MAFTTRKSLLAKVRAGDEVSWQEFYITYKPLILLCGNDCSLSQDENDELVLQVMGEIFRKSIIEKYDPDCIPENITFKHDPAKGRFRYFLKKIIRNQAIKIYNRRRSYDPLESIQELPDENSWESAWTGEWRCHLLNMALVELKCRMQSESYVAFEMYAIQRRPVKEVADFLKVSESAIYTAKSRCIASLKELLKDLEECEL